MTLNVEYLKILITRKGWSERQFALKTGLLSATISRIRNNKRGAGTKTIGAIRKALKDESIDKLFFWNGSYRRGIYIYIQCINGNIIN